jgi:hypothetical protein
MRGECGWADPFERMRISRIVSPIHAAACISVSQTSILFFQNNIMYFLLMVKLLKITISFRIMNLYLS